MKNNLKRKRKSGTTSNQRAKVGRTRPNRKGQMKTLIPDSGNAEMTNHS